MSRQPLADDTKGSDYSQLNPTAPAPSFNIKQRLKQFAAHKISNSIFKSLMNAVPIFGILLAYEKLSAPGENNENMLGKILGPLIVFFMYLPIFIYEKNKTDILEAQTKQLKKRYESVLPEADAKEQPLSITIKNLQANLLTLKSLAQAPEFNKVCFEQLIQHMKSQQKYLELIPLTIENRSYRAYNYHKTKIGILHYALNFFIALLSGLSTSYLMNRGNYRLISSDHLDPDQDQSYEMIEPFNPKIFDILGLIANGIFGAIGSLLVTQQTARAIINGYENYNQCVFKIETDMEDIREAATNVVTALKDMYHRNLQHDHHDGIATILLTTHKLLHNQLSILTGVGLEANGYQVVMPSDNLYYS